MSILSYSKPLATLSLSVGLSFLATRPLAAQIAQITIPLQVPPPNIVQPPQAYQNPPRPTNFNLAEHLPPLEIFIPPAQPPQTSIPTPPPNAPKPDDNLGRPSLSDMIRVQPAPLPSFMDETDFFF